tara:strand:+ start:383 stop:3412 length:3030 start_codon:yes stop_codon:yes gene_type:complete
MKDALTLERIQNSPNLQNLGAFPGDEIKNGKLIRNFSSKENRTDLGDKLTQERIDNSLNLQNLGAKEGDRVVDGKLKRLEQDSAFKQFMYSFDKPSSASDADYMADYIEQKVPLGMSRRDYLLSLLNPSTLRNTLGSKLEIKGNFSDGISGINVKNPDAIWGKGFMAGDENTKRKMMVAKYERDLIEEYGYGFTEGDSLANTLGSFASMLSSPTSVLPIGSSAIKMTLGSGALSGSYSVIEDLAREGEIDPVKAAVYTGTGAIAGFGLNKAGVGIQKFSAKRKDAKSKKQEIEDNALIDQAELSLARDIEITGFSPSKALEIVSKKFGDDILGPAIARTGRKLKMPTSKSHAKQIIQDTVQNDEVVARSKFKLLDDLFGSLMTRIRNSSEAVGGKLRNYEWRLGIETGKGMQRAKPFIENLIELNKTNPQLKAKITRELGEGNFDEVEKLLPDEIKVNFNNTKKLLQELGEKSQKAGVKLDLMENYFPRIVKDYDGLVASFGNKVQSKFDRMLEEYAESIGKKSSSELTLQEKNIVANRFARGIRKGTDTKPRYAKQRNVTLESLNDEAIAKFYESPEDSLALYIRNSVNNIEKYNFFGRNAARNSKGYFNNKSIDESIGKVIQEEKTAGRLNPIKEDELADLLQARFVGGEQQMQKNIGQLRDLGYMGTISNPYSAITQFGDLGNSGALHGFRNTIAAMLGTKNIKLVDAGINDISQEFAEGNIRNTAKALNWLFDKSGFRAVDRLGKETVMNASFRKAINQVKSISGEKKFIKEWQDLYSFDPDLLNNLVKDLKAFKKTGKITDDIKFHAFNELADVQPINLSEMPVGYLNNPNGRLFYSLKTFTLKQIDVARRKVYNEAKKGNYKEAAKNAATLSAYLSTLNLGTKTVKDLLVGRDVDADTLGKDAVFSLLGVYGVNEYSVDKFAQDKNVLTFIGRLAAPAVDLATMPIPLAVDIYKDQFGDDLFYEADFGKYIRPIPGVGPLFYNWFGGGAEKYNERKFDEKFNL